MDDALEEIMIKVTTVLDLIEQPGMPYERWHFELARKLLNEAVVIYTKATREAEASRKE